MNHPRIVIAAPKSGSGKTLISISLMQALKTSGKKINAFKCGPDYIDPLFHKNVLSVPSKNLDLFFTAEEETKALFLKDNFSDISIIEGVMGLYDGVGGITEEASTYHLAKVLKSPVLLVVDAKGMSRSVLAEISGFLSMDSEKLIKAIILNNMSGSLFPEMKKIIEEKFDVLVAGYFPKQKNLFIDSRYLGLKLPSEIENISSMLEEAGKRISETVDLKKIIEIAEAAPELSTTFNFPEPEKNIVRIAVARDEAFCFYYEDNLSLLKNLGAELIEFSPLHDSALPENIDGLILGGGYPELNCEKLEANEMLRSEIKNKIEEGIPVFAECGGFMYLHEKIVDEKNVEHKMCGIIKGKCFRKENLVRFGYVTLKELHVKAHEFHYYDSDANGDFCTAEKPFSGKQWKCGWNINGGYQGFAHLYYPSNVGFARRIVELCKDFKGQKK